MRSFMNLALLASLSALCSTTIAFGANLTALQLQAGLAEIADLNLPECAGACIVTIFPEYQCSLDIPSCMCPNANLTSDISACLFSNCTVPEQLLAERFAKTLCGAISRNEADVTRRVSWSLFALACFFVIARFIARPQRLHGSGYGRDDYTILSCLAVLIPFNTLIQVMTDHGLGADNYTLKASEITTMLEVFFVFIILYTILVLLTKISILQLYLRIWSEEAVTIWFRRFCWLLIVVHIITILAFCLAEIFICTPVSHGWTYWDGLHIGHCANRAALLYALGAINICYDVVVFVLPLHNFLKLNISWGRKAGVCTIFMVGLLVTICSIVRLQYLVKIGHSSNPTWEYNATVIWSSVEVNFSVVCTCMPAMAGLLQRIWATMSGKPLTVSSQNSKAPIHPSAIDPEKSVGRDEMLRMRRPDTFTDSVTEYSASDPRAMTSMKGKESDQSSPSSGGVEMRHEPPDQTIATRLSYRDAGGRRHEVKVIDKPVDD